MIIMKFGGSSIADAARIQRVFKIVKSRLARKPVMIASAFRGVTDDLIKLAHEALAGGGRELFNAIERRHCQIADDLGVGREPLKSSLLELSKLIQGIALVKELTPRTLDYAASFGERMSTRVIAAYFGRAGLPAEQRDAFDLGLITDDRFTTAEPLPQAEAAIRRRFRTVKKFPVITGFLGRTLKGDITTLGRNGSDYSASIFGAALRAEEIQIWSDTDGIMTADPRLVPDAKPLKALSFAEAGELAYYGGKVLHPQTLLPAVRKNIPVRVLNTFKPEHPGTMILAKIRGAHQGVKSIAFKKHQFLVSVSDPRMLMRHGFLARIFEVFARREISINMVSTSEVAVSVTTNSSRHLDLAVRELSARFQVSVAKDKAVVCVVGDGIGERPGVAGDVFSAVKEARVNVLMISQGASKINIAFVIENKDVESAVRALHRKFF